MDNTGNTLNLVDISSLDTEQRNCETLEIDSLDTLGLIALINSEDKKVAEAVEKVASKISEAVDGIYERLAHGGRLIYAGAGTSGRLGVLDAAECPPTFGVEPQLVQGLIAGGEKAFIKAVEGAEDSEELAEADLKAINFMKKDVLVGIAASGRTPYVIGALKYAGETAGGLAIALACTKNAQISKYAKIAIEVQVGPELLTGSTRMKSGTAQKMILNMLSTATMIKLGKTYGNLMVDVKATNKKLISRAVRIVCMATEVDADTALKVLQESDFMVKNAILMILAKVNFEDSEVILAKNEGRIALALKTQKQ